MRVAACQRRYGCLWSAPVYDARKELIVRVLASRRPPSVKRRALAEVARRLRRRRRALFFIYRGATPTFSPLTCYYESK